MAESKIFLVIKQDTVIQATSYIVRAYDRQQAQAFVDDGMYIEETASEILDTIESFTADVVELKTDGEGQKRQ